MVQTLGRVPSPARFPLSRRQPGGAARSARVKRGSFRGLNSRVSGDVKIEKSGLLTTHQQGRRSTHVHSSYTTGCIWTQSVACGACGGRWRFFSLCLSLLALTVCVLILSASCVGTSHLQRVDRSRHKRTTLTSWRGASTAMGFSHSSRQRHPSRQSDRGGRSLVLAAAATLAFGLPQLARGLLPSMQTRSTLRQAFWTRSLRYNPQRSGAASATRTRTPSRMSSMSSKVQQQDGCDEGLLSSPSVMDEGGDDVGEAVTTTETGRPSDRVGEDSNSQEQSQQSKWSWGRKNEGQERKGRYSFDWENGDRIVWKASKKSKVDVVSRAFIGRLFYACLIFGRMQRVIELVRCQMSDRPSRCMQFDPQIANCRLRHACQMWGCLRRTDSGLVLS